MLTQQKYTAKLRENISYVKETTIAWRKLNFTCKKCFEKEKRCFFTQKREKRRMNGENDAENCKNNRKTVPLDAEKRNLEWQLWHKTWKMAVLI